RKHRWVIIRTARARFQIVHVLESSAIVTHFVRIVSANPVFLQIPCRPDNVAAIDGLNCGQFGAVFREISGFLARHFNCCACVIRKGGRSVGSSIGSPAEGAFATDCAATGIIGTKKGSPFSREATLEPGCALRFAPRRSAPAPEQDRRPRIGFDSTRDCPAQKKSSPARGSRAHSSCAVAARYFTDAALPKCVSNGL